MSLSSPESKFLVFFAALIVYIAVASILHKRKNRNRFRDFALRYKGTQTSKDNSVLDGISDLTVFSLGRRTRCTNAFVFNESGKKFSIVETEQSSETEEQFRTRRPDANNTVSTRTLLVCAVRDTLLKMPHLVIRRRTPMVDRFVTQALTGSPPAGDISGSGLDSERWAYECSDSVDAGLLSALGGTLDKYTDDPFQLWIETKGDITLVCFTAAAVLDQVDELIDLGRTIANTMSRKEFLKK